VQERRQSFHEEQDADRENSPRGEDNKDGDEPHVAPAAKYEAIVKDHVPQYF